MPSSIRFQPDGPADKGLEPWGPIAAASLESGDGVQKGHLYFGDDELGLSAGVWDCTPFAGWMQPHPVNEFMILLEGEVTLLQEDGHVTTVGPGQSFFIPKGLKLQWRQVGRVRKYFVIYDGPAGTGAPGSHPSLVLDPAAPLAPSTSPPAGVLVGPTPVQAGSEAFADSTDRWSVGVWETGPYHRRAVPFSRWELMHVLEGGVSVGDGTGAVEHYGPGDTFFIAKGMVGDFRVVDRLRKLYCILSDTA